MIKLFKNRIFIGSLFFWVIDLIQGFVVLSPILVYLRIKFEKSGSITNLWPVPSADVLADIIINYNEIIGFYFITVIVLIILFQLLKSLFIAGIYHLIIFKDNNQAETQVTLSTIVRNGVKNWGGFIKADILSIPVFLIAIFIGMIFGDFAGNLGSIFKILFVALFFITASTYMQILRIQILNQSGNSIREAIKTTRPMIAGSLMRVLIGNISVALLSFFIVYLFWILLKFVKGADWNIFIAIITILIQQLIVLIICAAQALRINYNFSIIGKGE